MKIALAQINPIVGDLEGNANKIRDYYKRADLAGADLIVFPEQALTGYPCEDLLIKRHFLADVEAKVKQLTDEFDTTTVIGYPRYEDGSVYNSAAIITHKHHLGDYDKMHLPNYGVFDERRYFTQGLEPLTLRMDNAHIGLTICEDIWIPSNVFLDEAAAGANILLNLSASPYHVGKPEVRENMLAQRARDYMAAVVYVNQVGGQDELVFDGNSLVLDHTGTVIARGAAFEEDLIFVTLDMAVIEAARLHDVRLRSLPRAKSSRTVAIPGNLTARPMSVGPRKGYQYYDNELGEVAAALRLGIRDYVNKIGFKSVVIGVSGGIDSAVVTALAAQALGEDNVLGITMPTQYNSAGTIGDAHQLCVNLHVTCLEHPIQKILESYMDSSFIIAEGLEVAGRTAYGDTGVPAENLQARIRGNILMAVSNAENRLVLSCGNKSEMAVGYATLYGDMAGGYAPLKDVPKTMVFALAEYLNFENGKDIIPTSIITRPPSAELAEGQLDTNSLPPYEDLDPLLRDYVDLDLDVPNRQYNAQDLVTAERVVRLVNYSEYKRRQAPPGVKISTKAFGRDRRLPIVNRYPR